MSDTTTTREIPQSLTDEATKRVTAVNRRLTRLGLPPYTVTFTTAPDRPVYDKNGISAVVDGVPHRTREGRLVPCEIIAWHAYTRVTITGELPRLGDWQPVATLTWDAEAGVITRVWPGLREEPNLDQFRDTDPRCQQCRTRRHRRDTYVVRNRHTGELRQVGGNCLEAFTGVRLRLPSWLNDDVLDGEPSEWAPTEDDLRLSVTRVLAAAIAIVTVYGWVSRAKARDSSATATADIVWTALMGASAAATEVRQQIDPHLPHAQTQVTAVREHALSLDGQGEYGTNLARIAAAETVSPRNLGVLVSAVSVYARDRQREADNAARSAAEAASTWQGEVGKRATFTGLTVLDTRVIDSRFGTSTLVTMTDPAGNRFKWFASGHLFWDEGDIVTLTGRVKAHEEFREVRSTVLTRCVLASRVGREDMDRPPAQ